MAKCRVVGDAPGNLGRTVLVVGQEFVEFTVFIADAMMGPRLDRRSHRVTDGAANETAVGAVEDAVHERLFGAEPLVKCLSSTERRRFPE